jgi:osmotically-inducible protein OsmY
MTVIRNLLVAAFLGTTLVTGSGCAGLTDKTPKEAVSDAAIVSRAKAVLVADPVVKARNIHVTAVKGDVILSGVVKSQQEADRAVELVRGVPGVNSVSTALKVEA